MEKQPIPFEFMPDAPEELRQGKWDILLKRQEGKNERANAIGQEYEKRLEILVEAFFSGVGDDQKANEDRYNTFNKQWMAMARKANRTKKILPIDVKAFEFSITHTIRVKKLMDLEPQLSKETALGLPVENVIKLLSVSDKDRKTMLEMMLPKPTENNTTMKVVN